MGKGLWIGVDGVARKVKKAWIGVDGVARKVKKAWIGVDGVARLFYTSELGLIAGGQGFFNFYTEDGSTWSKSPTYSAVVTLSAVAYGNGTFVALGNGGRHLYSTDGVNWTSISALNDLSLTDVAFCKDRFMAVGYDGVSYYSFNGISWTAMPAFTTHIRSVCYNDTNDVIAICMQNSSSNAAIFYYCSRGATGWTGSTFKVSVGAGWLPSNRGLAWNGSKYIMALSYYVYSNSSGTLNASWSAISSANNNTYTINRVNRLGTSSEVGVVGAYGRCQVITSGLTVANRNSPDDEDVLTDIVQYKGGIYVSKYSGPAKVCKVNGSTWTTVLTSEFVSGNYVYFNYLCSGEE